MAHPDLDNLLTVCLDSAKKLLAKRGEFFPFAATLSEKGEVGMPVLFDGNEHPAPADLIAGYTKLFQTVTAAGGIRAVALCYDGRVAVEGAPKKDAVTVAVEHVNGETALVFAPYQKRFLLGYRYGSLIAMRREREFFRSLSHG